MVEVILVAHQQLSAPWAAAVSDAGRRVLFVSEAATPQEAIEGYAVVARR
jgi:hypothetical protein